MTSPCHSTCQTTCSFKDSHLLQAIEFTQSQLENTYQDAQRFHAEFLTTTQASSEKGLINPVMPAWAPRMLRKSGIAGSVIEKIGSNAFAKRRPEDPTPFLNYVETRLAEQQPLQFRIAFGPLKNVRHCGSQQSPDLAEYLTLIQLSRVMHSLSALYPHGIKVQIVPDDMRALNANRCSECYIHCYISGLQRMVKMLSFESWLTVEFGQKELFNSYQVKDYFEQAEIKLNNWKRNDPEKFDARWKTALDNARKNFNIELGQDTPEEVEAAAWRYLIAHQSEILSGMWSPPDVFPLVYANHPNCYQLYSLSAKKTKLPWQIALPKTLIQQAEKYLAA